MRILSAYVITCWLILLVHFVLLPARVKADIDFYDDWPLSVLIVLPGGNLARFDDYLVDLRNPDNNDNVGVGIGYSVTGADSQKVNCRGENYDYNVFQMDSGWQAELTYSINGGTPVTVVVSQVENRAYWDDYYGPSYTPPASCDYLQNCHGYAFGVGDWPDTAFPIIAFQAPPPSPGPGVGNGIGGPGGSTGGTGGNGANQEVSACWVTTTASEAVVASQPEYHSILVSGEWCPNPGPPVESITWSAEQFRESGVYTRSCSCPDSLNLSQPPYHPPLMYLYKPNEN